MTSIATIRRSLAASAESAGQVRAVREYRMPAKVMHWLTVALVAFMVGSGVTATQLGEGAAYDLLFGLHRLTGAMTLVLMLARLVYRLTRSLPRPHSGSRTRPLLHWALYVILILVPFIGWAGASASGSRDLFFGYALPSIWPEGSWDSLLLHLHAYLAFGLLTLVALHIGLAMQDYMAGATSPPAADSGLPKSPS